MSALSRMGAPLVGVVVDHSGSMLGVEKDMSSGVNGFLAEQTGADVVLVQFDHEYEEVYAGPGAGVPRYTLKPRGATALNDAVGRMISETAAKITDDTVWRQVVICIVSDGKDTCSAEWSRDAVADLIAYWQNNFRWQFVFLGCNFDAVKEAATFGIPEHAALTFDRRRAKESFALLSQHVAKVRAGQQAAFSNDDRRKALEA